MMVMSLLLPLLLLLLQGTGQLLLAMADSLIRRTAENRMLASVAGSTLQRQSEELPGCSIRSSGVVGKQLPPLQIHAIEWVRDLVRVIVALHHAIDKVESLSLECI